ncbi:MAG: hypothetical protein ACFNUN_08490 [Aggregatibacter sp.]|jgi:hypothetical protein|uniref:hypothetical protein n=1 Tax=Aggregatibacter sp. TaxID=1872413 RepID=UPI0036077AB4
MSKRKLLSKEKIEEYKGFLIHVKEMCIDMPDGAFFATMQSETELWLENNGLSHLDPYEFYIKYG